MDAILGDRFAYGRRLRPVTLEYALKNFPRMIIDMKQGKLHVEVRGTVRGKEILRVWKPNLRESEQMILRSDFEKCRDIAKKVSIPLFPSDNFSIIEDRIRAHIRVEFGSPIPPLPDLSPCKSA